MNMYLEINNGIQIWDDNGVKLENYKKIENLLKNYNFKYEGLNYYSVDIKLIRKIKISKLEGSSEFDNLIDVIFDTKIIKFIKEIPIQGEDGTSGISGSTGIEGISVTNGTSDSSETEENNLLLKELIGGTLFLVYQNSI